MTNTIMNTSTLLLGWEARSSLLHEVPTAENHVREVFQLVLPFVLASGVSGIFGSQYTFLHGLIAVYLNFWRRQEAWSSRPAIWESNVAVCILGLSICYAPSLVRYLRTSTKLSSDHSPGMDIGKNSSQSIRHHKAMELNNADQQDLPMDVPFFKSLLFPGYTTHRRFYPTRHNFKYPQLFVGIPVLYRPYKDNAMLSSHPSSPKAYADKSCRNLADAPAWLAVDASEYLQRGPAFDGFTLRAKLELYLISQGIESPQKAFPYAYLVTPPNFLVPTFNQVCFWYLYDANQKLRAMILEVNNTFDERRAYFTGDTRFSSEPSNAGDTLNKHETNIQSPPKRFISKFRKDFHVSPFNDRDGIYSVTAVDVVRTGRMDVTIVLTDDLLDSAESPSPPCCKPKMIGRLFSTPGTIGIDPKTLSLPQRLLFLLRYGWIDFLTIPLVLGQARVLWTKGLKVYYRPEPRVSTIPRVESKEETTIEERFRIVLDHLARIHKVRISYSPAAGVFRGQTITLDFDQQEDEENTSDKKCVELRILTPAFYTELVKTHGARSDLLGAFDHLCFRPKEREEMAECTSVSILHDILAAPAQYMQSHIDSTAEKTQKNTSSVSERWNIVILAMLQKTIEWFRFSTNRDLGSLIFRYYNSSTLDFDQLVQRSSSTREYAAYLRAVLMVLLADMFALGSMGLLRFQTRIVRVCVVASLTGTLTAFIGRVLGIST